MITEENLDTDCREIHYVSENGRVEGLILEKDPMEERTRRERPRSAKGRRRPGTMIIDSSRCNSDSDGSCRTYNVDSINEQGVNDLFSDILYDPDNEDSSDTENIGDYNGEYEEPPVSDPPWPNHSGHMYSSDSTITRTEHSSPHKYSARLNSHYIQVAESPAIISGVKYNEWQRNSGLRVLRKVLDRQKLLETTDGIGGKTQEEMIQVVHRFKKKPPNKLKPLGGALPMQQELSTRRRLPQTFVLSDSLKNL
eukprot:TRINITY_DN39792_c0_g1_i1.p1 TRINITY_DN39792_c0_g1~~TRINITY_DN39792_c0_g1_i1.p1  ORF type:complete len:253 (-),score=71.51 TRINITY_DN39792_c0_g1_i1:34-792(-)